MKLPEDLTCETEQAIAPFPVQRKLPKLTVFPESESNPADCSILKNRHITHTFSYDCHMTSSFCHVSRGAQAAAAISTTRISWSQTFLGHMLRNLAGGSRVRQFLLHNTAGNCGGKMSVSTFVSRISPITGRVEWIAQDDNYDYHQEIAR